MMKKSIIYSIGILLMMSCQYQVNDQTISTINKKRTLGITDERSAAIEKKVVAIMDSMSLEVKVKTLMGESSDPLLKHGEAISGYNIKGATTLPQQIGISCSWNPELVKTNTGYTSRMMRSLGTTLALSPMLDVARNAKWGRMEESFGESEYLTARMGLAFIDGMQTNDLSKGVATTTKHFAGYGANNKDDRQFLEEILMPHEVAVKIGNTQSLMPGYHSYKDVPAHASEFLLQETLRKKWGFNGVIVSDYFAVKQIFTSYNYAKDKKGALVRALKNGVDLELPAGDCYKLIPEALSEGLITIEEVDRSVKRILTLKGKLGLLDGPLSIDAHVELDSKEFRERAYISATQSIVLLKNDGILPIHQGVKKIALVGPNAASAESLLGDYTYQSLSLYWKKQPIDPTDPQLITLKGGLENKLDKDVQLMFERGCDWTTSSKNSIAKVKNNLGDEREKKVVELSSIPTTREDYLKALSIAQESDVIIAAMGENRYLCGESRSRKDIRLAGEQEQFVKDLITTGKPVVLIIFGGRPHVLNEIADDCAAIIQGWYPGEEGGNAMADILLGNVNPSAKMTVTVPRTNEQCPIYYGGAYKNKSPMFSFGHGLSYTKFDYQNFASDNAVTTKDEWIDLSFEVSNVGDMDGAEISQLYITPKNPSIKRPALSLQGFSRTELKTGEKAKINFKVSLEQLSFYDNNMDLIIEPGEYEFLIGASSTDIKFRKTIIVNGEKKILSSKNVFFSEVGKIVEHIE
ncbi:beta-glucosidase [Flammeovirga sp. MY04]|uniref:glycoside hydrolase family 3 N-terminal domain-containing protein n=1 Tax=Flammeovirga sp. MY04 TaxID=1191459 RepID=UPI0008060E5E|nr:glycoside hydrolase family 3 N-terminal domain-containing protein [Flammeovirga sp. MY04]ANQ51879.1 beta-glucosidase [Flammeovirga sp. MY04]